MNIPNDSGHPWRLNKFVEYQHKAASVAPPFLAAWARKRQLNHQQIVNLCWYHSVCYSEITAIYLLELGDFNPDALWESSKPNLIFGSARKHAKNMDWFPHLVTDFRLQGDPLDYMVRSAGNGTPEQQAQGIHDALRKLRYVGRFAADKYLEAFCYMCEAKLLPLQAHASSIDWQHGNNFTSGLYNIFYNDDKADEYGRNGTLKPEEVPQVDTWAKATYQACVQRYPNQDSLDFIVVMSKVCSFRNLFTGTRYGGFHHDRQLEQIRKYEKSTPGPLWNTLLGLRSEIYPHALLGELGGWSGIRSERKKLWLTQGLTGVEDVQE